MVRDKARVVSAVFCLVGIACAVFAVVARSRAQTPRRVVTISTFTEPAPEVGADDCPVNETCVVTGVRASVIMAVTAAFQSPPTNDLAQAALAGPSSETVHRETVDLRTSAGVLVTVVNRCVDQGSGVRASQSPTVPRTGPATVFVVVPGRPGCSVGVILQVPTAVIVPWAAATTLAHLPGLQLPG